MRVFISSSSFKGISVSVCFLLNAHFTFAMPEIDAFVMNGKSTLDDVSIEQQLAIQKFFVKSNPYGKYLTSLYVPRDSAELNFLNPAMRKMLYNFNAKDSQSNCYWTSHFSLGTIPPPERFMDLPEYQELLDRNFIPVDSLIQAQAGDIIRLKRARGNMELHSVVLVGKIRGSQSYYVVVSKNGPSNGPYLLMGLSELMSRVYPSAFIAGIYRKKID